MKNEIQLSLNNYYTRLDNLHKYTKHIYLKKKQIESRASADAWYKQCDMDNIKEQKLLIKRLLKLIDDNKICNEDK